MHNFGSANARQKTFGKICTEPLLIECHEPLNKNKLTQHTAFKPLYIDTQPAYEGTLSQRLTHQLIEARFFKVQVASSFEVKHKKGIWVHFSELKNYAFPKTIVSFLEKKLYFLKISMGYNFC